MRNVFRPLGNNLVYADDWRLVTQNSPSSVPIKYSVGNIRSDKVSDYDSTGTSNGAKFIIHWERPVRLKGNNFPYIQVATTYSAPICQFTLNIGSTSATASFIRRIRPIIAEFDPEIVTWDNTVTTPNLTYGTAFERSNSGSSTGTDLSFISAGGALSNGLFYGVSSVDMMYGVICDVKNTLVTSAGVMVSGARWPVSMAEYPFSPFVIPGA